MAGEARPARNLQVDRGRGVGREMVAHKLPELSLRYFDFGRADGKMVAERVFESNRFGIPAPLADWFAAATGGFVPVALMLAGAKDGARARVASRGGWARARRPALANEVRNQLGMSRLPRFGRTLARHALALLGALPGCDVRHTPLPPRLRLPSGPRSQHSRLRRPSSSTRLPGASNTFSPLRALGASIDRLPARAVDALYSPSMVKEVLSSGLGRPYVSSEHGAARRRLALEPERDVE